MTNEVKDMLLPKHPLGRFGMPLDIARLVAFLVSVQGEWVTGRSFTPRGDSFVVDRKWSNRATAGYIWEVLD